MVWLGIKQRFKFKKQSRISNLAIVPLLLFWGIMLLIGASGVFAEIQSSINFIWGLKAKPNKGIMKFIKTD
jgi:hypothetical protein